MVSYYLYEYVKAVSSEVIMTAHRFPIELPELVPLSKESPVETIIHSPPPPLEPRPMIYCLFSKSGKPLEAQYLDLAKSPDRQTLDELTRDLACDELSVILWPRDSTSPVMPVIDLLRRMVTQHALGKLPDSPFMRAWISEATAAVCDFRDIKDFLDYQEPPRSITSDEEDLDV
jgi:hypothetical protein